MKILDITNYIHKSQYKPELEHVFVKHIDDGIVYVATNSFRLCEITLRDENIKDLMREGYYTAVQWKMLASATKKKTIDFPIIKMIGESVDPCKDIPYPDYQTLYKNQELVPADVNTQGYNVDYFMDFLKLVKVDKFNNFNFSDFKQVKRKMDSSFSPLIYQNDTITVLLMPINK